MNRPAPSFRLVDEPLGADALERPSREEWDALWERERRQPVPDYAGMTLRRFVRRTTR